MSISSSAAIRSYLNACKERRHYSPTLDEIGAAVGLRAKSAVKRQVDKLVDEGYCSRDSVGRIQLSRREPVLVLTFRATDWGDEGHIYLPGDAFTELQDGQLYRVEVYRDEK